MKQQTNIRIATPCHENWNTMTPAEGGKFCASCRKSVIDFTLMSDAQILKFLSSHSGGLCGRFDAGQLERPLVEPVVSKKRSWYLALALPLSLLFQKSFGQKSPEIMDKPMVKMENRTPVAPEFIKGKTKHPAVVPDSIKIHGFINDESGMPVTYASVLVKGTMHGAATDSAGRFSIRLHKEDTVVLVASAVGYETVEKSIRAAGADDEQAIILTTREVSLGEVVVVGYTSVKKSDTVGDVTYRTISRAEKRDSMVKKILRLNPVTVYPNPARSGSSVQLNIKKAGIYEVQLLNNASALLKTETVQAGSDGTQVTFQLPQMAAGIYYLRLISSDRKTYVEKILIN